MDSQKRTAELSKEMDVLQVQLFHAKAHFDIFTKLRESWSEYLNEINCASAFWNLTMQSHSGMAVLYLCRLYDRNRDALHLTKFLEDVKRNDDLFNETAFRSRLKNDSGRDIENLAKYPRILNHEHLDNEIKFCSKNPLVEKLREWRNNMIAHYNFEQAVHANKPFHEEFPLPYEEIKTLIDYGFAIVNGYSSRFRAQTYSDQFLSHQKDDYSFVLESMRIRLEMQRVLFEKPPKKK